MDITIGLVSVLFLVLTNGFFVATEFAIVAVRRSRLDEGARRGSAAARAAQEVVRHLDAYLATCQLGITVASLALGWIGEPALAHVVEPPLESVADRLAPELAHGIAFAVSFTLITTMHIVVGEQAAKGLALQKTESTALFVSPIMRLLYTVLKWPVIILNWITNKLLGLFGLHSTWGEEMTYSVDELRLLLTTSREAGIVGASEARIASRAFEFADLTASNIITPRTELEAVSIEATRDEILEYARTAHHTRLLVYNDTLEDIIGVVHMRDLLRALDEPPSRFVFAHLLRPVLTVPEGKRADALLEEMRTTRRHVAVVLDEFGGTAGIVTLRDIVSGLIGRIENEASPQPGAVVLPEPAATNGELYLDGLMRIEEFEELTGVDLAGAFNDRAETIGGMVMAALGKIPDVGESITLDGREIEVVARDGLRVSSVLVHAAKGHSEAGEPDLEQSPHS